MSSILATAGQIAYQLSFQISPVFLSGGLAGTVPGGLLPIVAFTQAADFAAQLLGGSISLDPLTYFAQFAPIPGATLVDNKIGEYPFANQTVAANAIIAQPLRVSLAMACPVQTPGGYTAKLVTFIALQAVLAQHTQMGGTFTVATPSYIYTNCILTRLVDISTGDSKQVQTRWQWDFEQPLVTLAQAQQAQNNSMSKISSQVQTDGAPSGPDNAPGNVGANTQPYTGGMAGYGLGG